MATPNDSTPDEAIDPFGGTRDELGGGARTSDKAIIAAAVIAGLYFGRDVLVPIALAVLLSFVLTPLVGALQRLHIGRTAPVFLSVLFAFAILLGLGASIGKQVADLAGDLPEYQRVITKKVDALRTSDFSNELMGKVSGLLHGFNVNVARPSAPAPPTNASPPGPTEPAPLPVEVREPALGPLELLRSLLSALLPPLTTAAIVVIFVIFILLQQRDLRDRFISLIGAHDLHRTTRALDDAAARLSRYFSVLTAINATFGVAVAIGLALIGVPNPILWGILAAVLRFLPYIGAFLAAAFPMAIASAVSPGWGLVLETGVLFLVLETLTGQVVEPQLFGHTTGMSPLAVIVAAAFWTLIWGPTGLLLSTPITACLVVLGRHVESLNFIELLLGDRPPLSAEQSLYQRLLATDPDEAAFQAERLLKTMPLLDYYEDVALPALALAQRDITRGVLEPNRRTGVFASVEQFVATLADYTEAPAEPATPSAPAAGEDAAGAPPPEAKRQVVCFAGRTPLDQAACAILVQLLERRNIPSQAIDQKALRAEAPSLENLGAICIAYLDPQRMAAVRYSVRRLRSRFPGTPIVVCAWGVGDTADAAEVSGADSTVASLREALDFCEAAASPTTRLNPTAHPKGVVADPTLPATAALQA